MSTLFEGRRKPALPPAPRFALPEIFFTLALSVLLLSGCAKHPKKGDAKDKPETKKDTLTVKSIDIGAGYTTVWQSSDPKSPASFSLGWTKGGFDAKSGSVDSGKLVEPHGQIFQNGKPSSTYRSDSGDAVRATKRLNMRDHVVVQSLDKTQTLTAKEGEYRGDVKLVRMLGDVVAKGPFGTLSGAPELWATPDLKLIGTPDMVAKTLKIPALIALATTAAVGSPQVVKGVDYKLEGALPQFENLLTKGYRITMVPPKGKSVTVTLASRHTVITSAGTVVILTDPKTKEVHHMTSVGTARVVQTSDAGTTTMDGQGSVYDVPEGSETGTLKVGGRVTLNSVTRRKSKDKDGKEKIATQATVSQGDRGTAILLIKPPKDGDALKEATLDGNVTIESKASEGDGKFNGVGDHMVYTPHGSTADVDLKGSVVLTSTNPGKDEQGKPTMQKTVSRGQSAHAVLDPNAGADADPLKNATLSGGTVSIDVTGADGGVFKSTGDKVVYTATGGGNGRAVMTGDLKFAGDAPDYLGNIAGADTAIMTIGKTGWKTINLENSSGEGSTTNIATKTPPTLKKPDTGKGGKKKKGGKG